MGRAKVTITGLATKEPKIKNDGTVDLLMTVDMETNVPKGLKSLGKSKCLVHIGSKAWKKIAMQVNNESFYIIQGEVKANVSSKNTPFMEVIAFSVLLKDDNKETKTAIPKNKIVEPQPKIAQEKEHNQSTQPNQDNSNKHNKLEIFNQWYTKEDITYLSHNDLVLTEDVHFQARNLSLGLALEKIRENNFTMNNVIAVRPIENQKYSLVMGIRGYALAKLLNITKVPVVIKDMSYKDFVKQYAKNPNGILSFE